MRIPVSAAKGVADQHKLRQVILAAWDGERTHIVTYGSTQEDCAQAAEGGNAIQRMLGWPEKLRAAPPIIQKLRERIKELENQLASKG